MKKRIISLILALVMVLGIIPAASAANHPFTDVPSNAWYCSFVEYCYEHGLMSGTSPTRFEPNATMTRAMTVTVLYRLAGAPESNAKNPFTDIPAGKWYTNPVLWAVENGITSGTSATQFSPNAYVTREQLVTFLYRYAQTLGIELTTTDLSKYSDLGSVSSYARVPFAWAVENGIISGTSATKLSPRQTATRAQCATILARFDQWVNDDGVGEDSTPSDPTEPTECQHVFTTTVVYPTTESEGYNLHTCQKCGYQYKDTYTDKLPGDETKPTDPPSPTDPPATDPTVPSEPEHEHSYKKDQVVAPTCTEKGYTIYKCSCGDSYKGDETQATGHDYEVVEVVPPTCQETGWTEYKCSKCGDVYYGDDTDPTGHDYTSEVIDPTTTSEGYTLYTCKVCGYQYKDHYTDMLPYTPTQEDERQIAALIAKYINEYRNAQGSCTCEVLPKMTLVAEYRANQLTTNYAHDTYDTREAHAYYEYGVYVDATQFGDPAEMSYWTSYTQEAIGWAGKADNESLDETAQRIARSYKNSDSHWAYLGDNLYKYIAVGVKYSEADNRWYSCIMVGETNYG